MGNIKSEQIGRFATSPLNNTEPVNVYLLGVDDFLIPLVFPEYLIHVDGYEVELFGRKLVIPPSKAPYLGHAGVLLVNGGSGLTKYYEYGRYGPGGKVRVGRIPDVIVKSGLVVESSLKKVLRAISRDHGQSGPVSGVVMRGVFFDRAHAWLDAKFKENNNPARLKYDLGSHNCMTFVADLVDYVGLDSPFRPPMVVPTAYMEQLQFSNPDVEYDYASDALQVIE